MDNNFKFKISVSREGYATKADALMCLTKTNAKKIGREPMAFREEELTIDDFLGYALNGYSFCNLFNLSIDGKYHSTFRRSGKTFENDVYMFYQKGLNKGYFKVQAKRDEYFKGSQAIFVDIDETGFDNMYDFIETLSFQPTMAYYSYSDNIENRRFRLVYVFNRVLNPSEFRHISFEITQKIVEDTGEFVKDTCGCRPSQYFNGTAIQEYFKSHYIYSVYDFSSVDEDIIMETVKSLKTQKKDVEKELLKSEIVYDMENMSYRNVLYKYNTKGFSYFTSTDLVFDDDDLYFDVDETFVQLPYYINKLEDGHHRRKTLFYRAALRRFMKPDTTPEELLYNLYIDRYKFFNNDNGELSVSNLVHNVASAVKLNLKELDDIVKNCPYTRPSFKINPNVEDKRKAVGQVRRMKKDSEIGNLYDTSIGVQENLKILNENGVKVNKTRLYEYIKDNGIILNEKSKPVSQGYNPNITLRENMKFMNCSYRQVIKARDAYNKSLQ